MAFSSISQAGYILLAIISGTAMGMTSMVYYILVYMFSNLAAFGVISVIENQTKKSIDKRLRRTVSDKPTVEFRYDACLFSLAGIPPFAGFFSKFFVFSAAAQQGFYVLVFMPY